MNWSIFWKAVGIVVLLVFVVLVLIDREEGRPMSSDGVEYIDSHNVRITEDDTLILVQSGKPGIDWKITYDGKSAVHFEPPYGYPFSSERDYTLCGVDCETPGPSGIIGYVSLTQRADGSVDVHLPEWGWTYRGYR